MPVGMESSLTKDNKLWKWWCCLAELKQLDVDDGDDEGNGDDNEVDDDGDDDEKACAGWLAELSQLDDDGGDDEEE